MKLNPIILIVFIFLGVYVGLNINKEPVISDLSEELSLKNVSNKKEKVVKLIGKQSKTDYKYTIVHKIKKRIDGGISYYVLIEPVNVKNTSFKDKVKHITNELVQENGGKISIEIYDDKKALNLLYKLYGDMSLDRVLSKKEYIFVGNHHVATYSGELKTGIFYNTLYYYPAANPDDNPLVGKYEGAIEYNPK